MSEVWSLPGYDVQALLGFGATGEVWRACELATGDTVALKRLRAGADPSAVDALRREASLLRSLDTPYVVRLREVVGSGAETVLVLDHAPGGSLATLLARRGSLEPGEVVTIGAPLAQALAAAHSRGLVHGDVTPSNVLFTADGMPLLSDLGLARVAGERLASVDGTAEYVDPAVAGGGDPDAAADVWALAAVCHHMLAGSPPHDGGSVAEVLSAATSGSRAPLGLLAPSAPRALV
ncbi:MAG: Serine/threonine protein kinase, partial [Frankiales bacterium]|nr:Serine/threonine protein kinase [Frankiales bacterium]